MRVNNAYKVAWQWSPHASTDVADKLSKSLSSAPMPRITSEPNDESVSLWPLPAVALDITSDSAKQRAAENANSAKPLSPTKMCCSPSELEEPVRATNPTCPLPAVSVSAPLEPNTIDDPSCAVMTSLPVASAVELTRTCTPLIETTAQQPR